jgi:hypothetical protein
MNQFKARQCRSPAGQGLLRVITHSPWGEAMDFANMRAKRFGSPSARAELIYLTTGSRATC